MPGRASLLIKCVGISALVLLMGVAGVGQRGVPLTATKVPTTVVTGTLADTTVYTLAKPDPWNGTVFFELDSNNFNSDSSNWLYAHGIARAGNTRLQVGSLTGHAADNLVETLDVFTKRFGPVKRAIAAGSSLGGQVAAIAAFNHPDRFVAALPHCGGLLGWPAYLNTKLDVAFALKTLIDPKSDLPLVHIPRDDAPLAERWKALIEMAQKTPQGRACIALAMTLGQGPFWTTRDQPEPTAADPVAREEAAYRTLLDVSREFTTLRRRLEEPAGGATSWNTGVNYGKLFEKADVRDRQTVEALYRMAELSVRDDLAMLQKAPRIPAEPGPVDYVRKMYPFDGKITIPVLTMSSTSDPYVWSAIDSGYSAAVRKAGREDLLRLTYVHSAGHCAFSDAERIATYQVLIERLDTGHWPDTSPAAMNKRAAAVDLGPARFREYKSPASQRASLKP
jgi:pimeloyl-ACP methyl ester carboxylesterase